MKQLLTLLFIPLTLIVCGQPKDKYDILVDSLKRTGQGEKLIPYFLKQLKVKPNNESALRWLGFLYIEANLPEQSEKYYREALMLNPGCGRCYINIALTYEMRDDNKRALEFLDRAEQVESNNAEVYSERAKLKEQMGYKSGAMADHNVAVRLDPKNTEYLIKRAHFSASQGYFSFAITDLSQVIELEPKNYYPYFQRAGVYFEKQMFNDALTDISMAIRLDSSRHELYAGRGAIHAAIREHAKAVADYSKAIRLSPQDYLPYYNRAMSKYTLGDMDGSCADIYESYALLKIYDPENSLKEELDNSIRNYCDSTQLNYYYQRGMAFYNLGQFEKAAGIYTSGLRKFPDNAMLLSFRGNAFYALASYTPALQDYYAAIKNKETITGDVLANPKPAKLTGDSLSSYVNSVVTSVQIGIAEAQFALGHYEISLNEMNKAIAAVPEMNSPGIENYYNVRGYIFLSLGRYKQAMADFDKCLQLNPAFSYAYVNRAIAKINMGGGIKACTYTISGKAGSQMFYTSWTMPVKPSSKRSDALLVSALNDCNRAIDINSASSSGYYIRGRIKNMLMYGDYCFDLLKAKKSGYPVERELLQDCGK